MQPNPKPPTSREASRGERPEPLLEIIEDLVPAALHKAAWEVCSGKRWYFGHASHENDWSRFWKMDLDGDAAFDAIWNHARSRCEALVGAPLRVIRQYANGHTYGLGGKPHLDDNQPGTYTLLYYPNPEWKDGWDGETIFYDAAGEIAMAIRPRPNRAVLFDSRILHAGRAPSRICPALRVTVAYKLQVAGAPWKKVSVGANETTKTAGPGAQAGSGAGPVVAAPAEVAPTEDVSCEERVERRDGALRVFELRVAASVVDRAISEELARLGKTVRLPGFRPGKIPITVLRQRYGAQARKDAVNHIVAETAQKRLPKGSVIGSFDLHAGGESGDLEFQATATYLADLPPLDFSTISIERLSATDEDLQSAGLSASDAAALFRRHLKRQVLDRLDAAYSIPLLPFLVEREFAKIWEVAKAQTEIPSNPAEREAMIAEFREIAARRIRLGAVVAEISRRNAVNAPNSAEIEDKVIDLLVSQARVQERQAGVEELRELAENE